MGLGDSEYSASSVSSSNNHHAPYLNQLQITSQPQTLDIRIAGPRNCPLSVLHANPDRPFKGRLAGHIRIEIPPTVLLRHLLQASHAEAETTCSR